MTAAATLQIELFRSRSGSHILPPTVDGAAPYPVEPLEFVLKMGDYNWKMLATCGCSTPRGPVVCVVVVVRVRTRHGAATLWTTTTAFARMWVT